VHTKLDIQMYTYLLTFREFRPLPNCRHVVILGNPKATVTDDYYMYVYDLVEKCIVQSTELVIYVHF